MTMEYPKDYNKDAEGELHLEEPLSGAAEIEEHKSSYMFQHEKITAETAEEAVNAFIQDITRNYRARFEELIKEYNLSRSIVEYFKNKGLLVPRFEIHKGAQDIKRIIRELNLNEEDDIENLRVKENELLVIFNLPKPLAVWWWKEASDIKDVVRDKSRKIAALDDKLQIPTGTVITWGDFYRALMPVVWATIGYFESESNFYFERLNPCGQHDPVKYYYVWLVGGLEKKENTQLP